LVAFFEGFDVVRGSVRCDAAAVMITLRWLYHHTFIVTMAPIVTLSLDFPAIIHASLSLTLPPSPLA
jgi:hypothetical protein